MYFRAALLLMFLFVVSPMLLAQEQSPHSEETVDIDVEYEPPAASAETEAEVQLFLEDIGVSEAEMTQLELVVVAAIQPYQEKLSELGEPSLENYQEMVPKITDQFIFPMIAEMKTAASDSLSADQYGKMMTRMYQLGELASRNLEMVDDEDAYDEILGMSITSLFIADQVFEMDKERQAALLEMQKNIFLDVTKQQLEFEAERDAALAELQKEIDAAVSDEEKAPLFEKAKKIQEEVEKKYRPRTIKMLSEMKAKFNKLLTPEQRAQLEKMMDDVPEYLWKSVPGNQGKEREWRPGEKSWKPGEGVPENLENHPGEAKRPRKERSGFMFPGVL